jgi:tripartite-type tricarboxylate transporter receptor subunit TctC
MTLSRRRILQLAGGAAAASAIPDVALAADYPNRPLRMVVGYTAGSAPDIAGRLIGQFLSDNLGQQVVVENKPGGGTTISTEAVVRAAPDGYTLLLIATPNTLGNLLHENLSFDFVRDIAPVAYVGATPFVMIVPPSFPAKTVAEFIAYAKANPGKVNMASNGTGNLTHISGELFKMMADVDLFHVPYHGELEAQADMLAGRAHVMFDPIISCIGQIKAGKLRALAVTTPKPVDSLPGVPTVGETVSGYEVTGGLGLGAPRDTPPAIIDKLNSAIKAALANDKVRGRLIELGNIPTPMTPADYRAQIARENDKWAKVIKFANIKLS